MPDLDQRLKRLERLSVRLREVDAKASELRGQVYEELEALHEAGATISALARALGVSRQRVQQLLR
jgi:hypothetical protein